MSKLITLNNTVQYSKKRIKSEDVTLENFISTDNMLQNKLGITQATNLPPNGQAMPSYFEEDILVANIRPYLKKIWFADKNGGCSSDVLVFETKKGYIPKFIYYNLFRDDFFDFVMKGSKGTKMPRGDKNQILNYLIPDFELSTQKKIAKVLSDLDTKIELNNKINTELEAMAKMLYDYWFVQFDFPDANGKPYKSSGGKMVWNEELKSEIPVGWEVKELSDIANIIMGQSPPGESYNEEGLGTVFYQGCTDFGNRFPTIRKYTTSPTRFAKQGDILLSVRAPVGTMNIAKENCCIGRGLASLNSKDNCIAYLFGVMVNLKQIFDRRNVDGTTFGSITKDDLFSLNVLKPSNTVLLEFDKIVNPCFQKQNKLEEENIQLSSLRDWLLPMLMNGQVSVGEVAKEYKIEEEILGMVAEPIEKLKTKKETKVIALKPSYVDIYKRTLLAAEIVFQLHNEATLGHLKLQKLLYLCQEINNMSLPMNFLKQAMGPYDNRLMRSLDKQFEEKKWFKFEKTEYLKYKPLVAVGSHQKDYLKYFDADKQKIDYLINIFRKYKSNDIEAVATLYACWKEANKNNELVNLELILKKFYSWSKEKEKFNPDDLKKHLSWMKNNGIYPN